MKVSKAKIIEISNYLEQTKMLPVGSDIHGIAGDRGRIVNCLSLLKKRTKEKEDVIDYGRIENILLRSFNSLKERYKRLNKGGK